MNENPYEPPETVHSANPGLPIHWYHSVVAPISGVAFWLGIVFGILGSLITFIPGGEVYWFGFTSLFIACGIFAPGYKYKIAAITLLALCLLATYSGCEF